MKSNINSFVCVAFAFTVLLLASNAQGQFSGSLEVPDEYKVGFDTITPDQAQSWLSLLAGPKFGGRGTGQVGYTKAAHWVAGRVAEFGLDPMGDGGTYFQMLPMSRLTIDDQQSKIIGPKGLEIVASGNLSFDRFADQPEVTGNVVFLTLSGTSPTIEDGTVLRDKVVVFATDAAAAPAAAILIARQGPAAALRVVDSLPQSSSQLLRDGGRQRSTSVSGNIMRSAAESLINAAGGTADWIKPVDAAVKNIHPTETAVTLQLRIRQSSAAVPNVIAWLEGSDPKLKDEYIVIGAHLDHLGNRGDALYPGADDNGSGSTAVLSIARAMAENPVRPKRSVLFMWFAAEEMGLIGSDYYCQNPILPVEKMVCMFNIDMVGRNEEKEGETAAQNENTIHLIGSQKGDMALHDVIMKANQYVNFEFEYDEESVFGRSDQANFYNRGASVAFLFGGFHPDYHRPTDKPEKINFKKIASAARLFYVAIQLASEHGPFVRPAVISNEQKK